MTPNDVFDNPGWGVIAQARRGSTRLPDKMMLPFANEPDLLTLVLKRLLNHLPASRILLATTVNSLDDALVETAGRVGVEVFRGSESNVLDRFIQAARYKGWTQLVRVCSDNPFLDAAGILSLARQSITSGADYTAWFFRDGLPAIRSHTGFFTEWVSREALEKIQSMTKESFFEEHVTNYIYQHPELFRIGKIIIENDLYKSIRLTIDTPGDLEITERIYLHLLTTGRPLIHEEVSAYIAEHPKLLEMMKKNIDANTK